ncbi:MAG: ankyrin repeat domain-containing protein [Rickettsia endosymbiont of Stiretrus anchorago]|nr:ankyrin repeat domain-containing protein [Rickettsia endosymbiont of Stiretrus anchorago]
MKDNVESRSISPNLIHKNGTKELNNCIVQKEYQQDHSKPVIKRFAINPDHTKYLIDQNAANYYQLIQSDCSITKNNLHRVEIEAFECAFKELNNQDVYTVLVDTFEREDIKDAKKAVLGHRFKADLKTQSTAIHAICLWKELDTQGNYKIFLIDPSNSKFTSYLKNPLNSLFTNQKNLHPQQYNGYTTLEIKSHTGNTFYAPPSETDPEDYRDCIDIAVKIAFKLNTKENINELSNQVNLNPSVIDNSTHKILIKELQSSTLRDSKAASLLLERNKGIIATPNIKSLTQLESLNDFIENFYKQFPDLDIKIMGRESEEAYMRMLFQSIQEFGLDFENILKRFELFLPKIRKSINDCLGNNTDKDGNTVLHVAAIEKEYEVIDILLSKMKSEDIIKKALNGYTALHLAVLNNDNMTVKMLVNKFNTLQEKQNLDVFLTTLDNFSFTALHLATVENLLNLKYILNNVKVYEKLIFHAENLESYEPAWDYKLLRSIAGTGNEEIVKILLEPLSETQVLQLINLTDNDGHNILHFAVLGGAKIIELLLNKISPESHDKIITDAKYHILDFAARHGTAEVFEVLLNAISAPLDREQSYNILCNAVFTVNTEVIDVLLKNEPDVINHVDSNGRNILHYMTLGDHKGKGAIELLTSLESKPGFSKLLNAPDVNGQTVLHFAIARATTVGDVKVVEWLIEKMISEAINASDNNGDTALYIAVKKCYTPIIELLIEKLTLDSDTTKVTSYLDLIYSIENTTPREQYEDNGTFKQEFSQMLTQAFSLIMEPGVHTDDLNGIWRVVCSKVNELERNVVKKLIDNKLQELQHIPEAVSNQELSICLGHVSEESHEITTTTTEVDHTDIAAKLLGNNTA